MEDHNGTYRFLETKNTITAGGVLRTAYYHKNVERRHEGKPPLKNVVPFQSHIPQHVLNGRAIGALHRVHMSTHNPAMRMEGVASVLLEMQQTGMTNLARDAVPL